MWYNWSKMSSIRTVQCCASANDVQYIHKHARALSRNRLNAKRVNFHWCVIGEGAHQTIWMILWIAYVYYTYIASLFSLLARLVFSLGHLIRYLYFSLSFGHARAHDVCCFGQFYLFVILICADLESHLYNIWQHRRHHCVMLLFVSVHFFTTAFFV